MSDDFSNGEPKPASQGPYPARPAILSSGNSYHDDPLPPRSNTGLILGICAVCLLLFIVAPMATFLLMPMRSSAPQAARRMQCTNHIKQIMIALHNYHDTYNSLPPAYTTDASGKPLHSWRVLILPFIEQQALYDNIKLDEPWDSLHNWQFHSMMPPEYACPSSPNARPNSFTCYQWVIGPDTISDGPTARKLGELSRGTSNVIGVVEVHPTTNWMQPTDVGFADLFRRINFSQSEGIGSFHPGGINVGMMDGSVRFISETVDNNTFQEMFLIHDPGSATPASQPMSFEDVDRIGTELKERRDRLDEEKKQYQKELEELTEKRNQELKNLHQLPGNGANRAEVEQLRKELLEKRKDEIEE